MENIWSGLAAPKETCRHGGGKHIHKMAYDEATTFPSILVIFFVKDGIDQIYTQMWESVWHERHYQLCELFSVFPLTDSRPVFLHSVSNPVADNPPVEKKYKPLNTTPNATKEIKVKIIPAQRKAFSFSIAMEFKE